MSAPPGNSLLGISPPHPENLPQPSSRGLIRSRDEFEAGDADDASPHAPKILRSSKDADAGQSGCVATKEDVAELEAEAEPTNPTVLSLLEELECGMCAGLYIDPVALNGCGHTFCGSCVVQWINSLPRFPVALLPGDPVPDPISCPQCRHAPIQTATPSRMAKTMAGLLLQAYPGAARPENEHKQAEALYKASTGVLKFPTPPPAPRLNERDYWRPCKWCYPEGDGWKCPVPVPRFEVLSERPMCIRTDGFTPEGHRLCAGCERLTPANAPTSVSCGICGEGFCGDAATACDCPAVSQSKPSNSYNALGYLLEDCPTDMLAMAFKDNWTEMYNMGVYLGANTETSGAQNIYKAILEWLRSPEGIDTGGVLGLMTRADIGIRLRTGAANEMQQCIMPVEEGATEDRVCSGCSDEILCSGIFEWWMRQLQKPEIADKMPANMKGRPNCKSGRKCTRQDNDMHAKKYNHICEPLPVEEAAKLHQDDTMPAGEGSSGANNTRSANPRPNPGFGEHDSESDDDEGDGSDDESSTTDGEGEGDEERRMLPKPNYTDGGAQWEAAPAGTVITVQAPPMLPHWSSAAPPAAPTPQQPAVAIANLVHGPCGSEVTRAPSPNGLGLPLGQPSLRVSEPASSPLAGPPLGVAPHLIFTHARRAMTPPLGVSQAGNTSGVADATVAHAGPSGTNLSAPVPTSLAKSSPTRFTFDAVVGTDILTGRDEGSAMDLDP